MQKKMYYTITRFARVRRRNAGTYSLTVINTSTSSVTALLWHLPTIIVQTRGESSLLELSRVQPIIIENKKEKPAMRV